MNFLGIDIGTSGCKAVAFDEHGRPVADAQREYALHFTGDGGAELDPAEVLDRCVEIIGEITRKTTIGALGISSQGEAFTPVDRHGRPLARAWVKPETTVAPRAAGSYDAQFARYRQLYPVLRAMNDQGQQSV